MAGHKIAVLILGLVALMPLKALADASPESGVDTSTSVPRETKEAMVSYFVSFPTAGTHDFIQNVSFLGFGIDGGYYVIPNLSLGISLRWIRFIQSDSSSSTYTNAQGSITGAQFKSENIAPILFRIKYDIEHEATETGGKRVVPYVAVGTGAYYGQRYLAIGAFNYNTYGWQFGFSPEIGVQLKSAFHGQGAFFAARYDAALGTDAFPAYSAFSLAIGIRSVP